MKDNGRLTYGVCCKDVDFKLLESRNRVVKEVIGPLMDLVLEAVRKDREAAGEGRRSKFNVNLIVVAEPDLDA
jgi:hypothetical protein